MPSIEGFQQRTGSAKISPLPPDEGRPHVGVVGSLSERCGERSESMTSRPERARLQRLEEGGRRPHVDAVLRSDGPIAAKDEDPSPEI
jgi:hypothetical protein